MHQLTRHLLINRGITDEREQEIFLNPDYERDIGNPFDILNMEKAANRILSAMRNGEQIVIYGDYDCDGIPGSVILHDLFKKIGYDNFYTYIPHRHNEGYGFSTKAVESFIKDKVDLIVTVDCGISDFDAVDLANTSKIDVIITDHHIPGEKLPNAFTILNSKQEGDTYHDDMLCGAGVAFKLTQAILRIGNFKDISPQYEKWLLDMVGISTIADMVPLTKENRALAYFGLKVLKKSNRPGLKAMLSDAKVDQNFITEEDIGFSIAPRINAASRMADPIIAFKVLSTEDEGTAVAYAKELERLNNSRKIITKEMVKDAHIMLEKIKHNKPVIVIGKSEWTVGVAGIVAAQLVEHYRKPVFVWCGEDGEIKGSCRADGSINLYELMHAAPDGIFSAKGGHMSAGGFSIEKGKIDELSDVLNTAFLSINKNEVSLDGYVVDSNLQIRDVNKDTYNAICSLAPFGEGNRRPVFAFPSVNILSIEQFGKTKEHLRIKFTDETNAVVEAIAWFKTSKSFDIPLSNGSPVTLIAFIEESRFLGRVGLRLRILDIIR